MEVAQLVWAAALVSMNKRPAMASGAKGKGFIRGGYGGELGETRAKLQWGCQCRKPDVSKSEYASESVQ